MGLKITFALIIAVLVVLILNFIGPEYSEHVFWKSIRKIKTISDNICYCLFNILAIPAIFRGYYLILSEPLGSFELLKLLQRICLFFGISIFAYIIFYSIYRYVKDKQQDKRN